MCKWGITRAGVRLKAGSDKNHLLLQSFCLILQTVLECVHRHIDCLRVKIADCFPDFLPVVNVKKNLQGITQHSTLRVPNLTPCNGGPEIR